MPDSQSDYRTFLNARLRDALLKVCPLGAVLCFSFVFFSLYTRPLETRWTTAAISLASSLSLASYYLALRFRPRRMLIEIGATAIAAWLIVDATASTIISSQPTDLVYLGVIALTAGSVLVHRWQMLTVLGLSSAGGLLAWMAGPRDGVWFEVALASVVAMFTGAVAFRARLEAFGVAFEQGREKLEAGLRYQRAADGSESALWEYEPATDNLTLAPRWAALFGYDHSQLGRRLETWTKRVHRDDRKAVLDALRAQLEADPPQLAVEHRILCADGSFRWVLVGGKASLDSSGRVRVAGSFIDINQRKQLEERLRHEALHDRLTDLANRRLLIDRLDQLTALVERHPERRFAVAFFDLDGFKRINDRWGHAAGDQVLIEVAERLKTAHRSEDLVARLGGDEFVVVLDEAASQADAEAASERTRLALEQPIDLDGRTAWVSVSTGVAWSGDGYASGAALLEAADLSMYAAKHAKRDANAVDSDLTAQRRC